MAKIFYAFEFPLTFGATKATIRKARELRKNMTAAEKLLWNNIRNGSFKKLKFRRQHPVSGFIVDFYCHKANLVIEIDGEIHHTEEVNKYDALRETIIKNFGLKIIRFTNDQVFNNMEEVLNIILNHIYLNTI